MFLKTYIRVLRFLQYVWFAVTMIFAPIHTCPFSQIIKQDYSKEEQFVKKKFSYKFRGLRKRNSSSNRIFRVLQRGTVRQTKSVVVGIMAVLGATSTPPASGGPKSFQNLPPPSGRKHSEIRFKPLSATWAAQHREEMAGFLRSNLRVRSGAKVLIHAITPVKDDVRRPAGTRVVYTIVPVGEERQEQSLNVQRLSFMDQCLGKPPADDMDQPRYGTLGPKGAPESTSTFKKVGGFVVHEHDGFATLKSARTRPDNFCNRVLQEIA